MNAVEALLVVFDGAWKDDFESLADACADLTEEESVWQPPAYKREPHDQGVGRPGTILWHLNHLELCHRYEEGCIRLLASDQLFDRALESVIGNLRQLRNART